MSTRGFYTFLLKSYIFHISIGYSIWFWYAFTRFFNSFDGDILSASSFAMLKIRSLSFSGTIAIETFFSDLT